MCDVHLDDSFDKSIFTNKMIFAASLKCMSYLYNIFSRQVAKYCADSSSPDCNKNLLISGVRNLVNLDEIDLDRMDPYQRDADDIIWRAMMKDVRVPAKYSHEDSYDLGKEDPLATSESDDNGLGEESARINDYARPSDKSGPYLVGPMVIRVFPDGRPVPEDAKKPLPRDEDVEEMKYSKIPSISEIEANNNRAFFNLPNALNVYTPDKSLRRANPTTANNNNLYYRRYNTIYRDRRMPEVGNSARIVRFY
ncbi:rhythmically expressed gene 5 protein isoform X2 [Venturia canescens]|uniref:rhythmically expressed gene 5 protein isoform X2 n=1 Tax=Venturia canescens TaxID=32260 RepID=UPI001C9C4737|nr:rhythmically expressed gene 5 protein isoform X2 [Venturia canescens]